MKKWTLIPLIIMFIGCNESGKQKSSAPDFNFFAEQFADIKIMRYQVPGFENLSQKQKELVYYLSQAAVCGRDIVFDQNYKHNLLIRSTLEEIYLNYNGDKSGLEYQNFVIYLKRVWFSNGIHHHYSTEKFIPEISEDYLITLLKNSPNAKFAIGENENLETFAKRIGQLILDKNFDSKRVCQTDGEDLVANSAVNFYSGVTQMEVEKYYQSMKKTDDLQPVSHGLNSKLVKENSKLVEKTYKVDGLYTQAIEKIVYWLEKAIQVSENETQAAWLMKLVEYYKTGDLKTWDEYNVLWLKDTVSMVDVVNGFIETYGDPMDIKATWESVVSFKDLEATKRAAMLSENAQWFENNSPIAPEFKKVKVKGVSAKVITVAQLGGDCYPSTPIGINLPNADWIRKMHGSKSVTMENITYAYDQAAKGNGMMEEFAASPEEIERDKRYGSYADNLHTDMHECLGHGSGQLLPGVAADAMKNYSSALEESRADLFGLYFMADAKLKELGLVDSEDLFKSAYESYVRNGLLTQLVRIEPGKNVEQAHMRCRKLISEWVYEKGRKENIVEMFQRDGKTFVKVNDFEKLRVLFGQLLAEIQRIKSTGDYEAGKAMVETYAIHVDPVLHKEILDRYKKLNLAPYGGFINPQMELVKENDVVKDVIIKYTDSYTDQMLYYSKHFSYLPIQN